MALADDSGAVVEQYVYDPYGQTYIEDATGQPRPTSVYGNPFMWTGQRYDAVTGLYGFTFRTYSPTLGRWLQRDPLGYVDGVNLYGYAYHSPLRFRDAYGLDGDGAIEGSIRFLDRYLYGAYDRALEENGFVEADPNHAECDQAMRGIRDHGIDRAMDAIDRKESPTRLGASQVPGGETVEDWSMAATGKGWVSGQEGDTSDRVCAGIAALLPVSGKVVKKVLGTVDAAVTPRVKKACNWVCERFGNSKRAIKASGTACTPSKQPFYVLGRQVDTAVAKNWSGHSILDIPNWSIPKNDAWIQNIIDTGGTVYLGSPQIHTTPWDSVYNRETVFARELRQLLNAGYTQMGDYLYPPR